LCSRNSIADTWFAEYVDWIQWGISYVIKRTNGDKKEALSYLISNAATYLLNHHNEKYYAFSDESQNDTLSRIIRL
jgi:hypothetical protein